MYHLVLVPGLVFMYIVPQLVSLSQFKWDLPGCLDDCIGLCLCFSLNA